MRGPTQTLSRPLAALAVLLFSLPARADPTIVLNPPPIVLILLDTSGSMEYTPDGKTSETGDTQGGLVALCGLGSDQRSRFVAAEELLLGAYQNYSCSYDYRTTPMKREDEGYIPPHVVPAGTVAGNGLMDTAADRIKFVYSAMDSEKIPGQGNGGNWNYGGEKKPNYGIRNNKAPWGGLVVPPASDDPAQVVAGNAAVKSSLTATTPYGETPIAPMLRDAVYFFQNEPALQPYDPATGLGDPYAACRAKHVLLITDGRANLAEGTGGYGSSVSYASQLKAMGVKVSVVGFNLVSGPPALLDQIASAGGTGNAEIVNPSNYQPLVKLLVERFLGTPITWSAVQSRTRIVVTDDTGRARAATNAKQNIPDAQYQFQAAWTDVPAVPGLKRGFLERQVYQCTCGSQKSTDTAIFCDTDSLSDRLDKTVDAGRTVWAMIAGKLEPFTTTNTAALTPDAMGIPTSGPLPGIAIGTPAPATCVSGVLGDAANQSVRLKYSHRLIKYLRAAEDTCRASYKTGAIVHSTPAIQAHLDDVTMHLPSAKNYANAVKNRPTVLYVGTHDGLLHAFRVDKTGDQIVDAQQWGREIWAFMPNHLLRRAWDLPANFRPLLDGSVVVRDVLLSRTFATLAKPADELALWRTVLVAGYRGGGRGYFGLDVTDPLNPKLLWEISNDGRWVGGQAPAKNPTCGSGVASDCNDFSRLGYSYSRPEVGVVSVDYGGGSIEQVAVAVFGGGSSEGLTGEPAAGRSVFVVRLDNGGKVWESNQQYPNVGADLLGDVACHSTSMGTFIGRCYLGDRNGRLWRVELGWNATRAINMVFDPYPPPNDIPFNPATQKSPVYEAPALSTRVIPNQLVIVYGAGDSDDILDRVRLSFLTSVTEGPDPDNVTKWKVTQNWVKYYASAYGGEKLMGPPIVFASAAMCVTFAPDPNQPCQGGNGTVWGFDYWKPGKAGAAPVAALDADCDPKTVDLTDHLSLGTAVPYGVTVVRRPVCYNGQPSDGLDANDLSVPKFGSGKQAKPTVVVQTGIKDTTGGNPAPPAGTTQPKVPTKELTNLGGTPATMFATSWGFVFD